MEGHGRVDRKRRDPLGLVWVLRGQAELPGTAIMSAGGSEGPSSGWRLVAELASGCGLISQDTGPVDFVQDTRTPPGHL